jgi:hypothetical protein
LTLIKDERACKEKAGLMRVNACGRQHGILQRERGDFMISVRVLTTGQIKGLKRLLEQRYAALLEDSREDVERDVREAKQLSAALAQIDEGTFGRCVQCGDDIDFKRLLADPAAARCVRCQSVYERTRAPVVVPTV